MHLSCNEVIPADIILLHSSDDSGICHIDTSNLDGENNLKQRQIVWGLRSVILSLNIRIHQRLVNHARTHRRRKKVKVSASFGVHTKDYLYLDTRPTFTAAFVAIECYKDYKKE